MRQQINQFLAMLLVIITSCSGIHAQAIKPDFTVDSFASTAPKTIASGSYHFVIYPPKHVYSSTKITRKSLQLQLNKHDNDANLPLYSIIRIEIATPGKQKKIGLKVPVYNFQHRLTTYTIDSVWTKNSSYLIRLGITDRTFQQYLVSINRSGNKIDYIRLIGAGTAGSFSMCNTMEAKSAPAIVMLDHTKPAGRCFELYSGYRNDRFVGRGTSISNRNLVVLTNEFGDVLKSRRVKGTISEIIINEPTSILMLKTSKKSVPDEVPLHTLLGEE